MSASAPTSLGLAALYSMYQCVAAGGDGTVSYEQFRELLITVGLTESLASERAKAAVKGTPPRARFKDFCKSYIESLKFPLLAIQRQFEAMDTDFDGKISRREMMKHFTNEYKHLDAESKVDQLFGEMDADKDKWVYFEELKKWYSSDSTETGSDNTEKTKNANSKSEDSKNKDNAAPNKKPSEWSVENVSGFLTQFANRFGLQKATIEQLRVEECDGATLKDLDRAMLRQMGLSIGQANGILNAVSELNCDDSELVAKYLGGDGEKTDSKEGRLVTSPDRLALRQLTLTAAHYLSLARKPTDSGRANSERKQHEDSKAEANLDFLRTTLEKLVDSPEQNAYRSICKDYIYPLIGIYHETSALPMRVELFLKKVEMSRKIQPVVKAGYKDIEFWVFLAGGSREHKWMDTELKAVFKSLGFSTFEQQTCRKELLNFFKQKQSSKRRRVISKFKVGQRIQYLSRTRGDWHAAVVKNVRNDGSCLVKLDAGAVKIATPNMLQPVGGEGSGAGSEMDIDDQQGDSRPNSQLGEVVVMILREIGFAEDDETGFWLLLDKESIPLAQDILAEIQEILESPTQYLTRFTSVIEPEKKSAGSGSMDLLQKPASPPVIKRQLSTRSTCQDAFKDALRYASGLYGSVSKEWVLGCLQNLHMLHIQAMKELEEAASRKKGLVTASPKNGHSELDRLRLQLEAKFANELQAEKDRLLEASMSIVRHAEQKGNVAQLPDEKQAIQSGRLVRIKLWPSSTYDPSDPAQYHFRLAESQFFRMMGNQANLYKVQQVEYIVNPKLVMAYNSYKSSLIANGTIGRSQPIEERLAFHGTSQEVMELIITGGFKIGGKDVAIASGAAYGYGVYTSEEPAFALHYIKTTGLTSLLFCKVLMTPDTTKVASSNANAIQQIISPNAAQVLPSYLVHFTKR